MIAAEELENEKEVVSVEDNGREAVRMFLWALQCWLCLFEKVQTLWLASRCLILQASSFFIYRSTVYVHTDIHRASVCFRSPPKYDANYWIFNVPT